MHNMNKYFLIPNILLFINFISCSLFIDTEPQRPYNIPINAKWIVKYKKWGYINPERTNKTFWYDNGVKDSFAEIINDELSGKYIGWHMNGNKSQEGLTLHNNREGYWIHYHNNGKIQSSGTYKNNYGASDYRVEAGNRSNPPK